MEGSEALYSSVDGSSGGWIGLGGEIPYFFRIEIGRDGDSSRTFLKEFCFRVLI